MKQTKRQGRQQHVTESHEKEAMDRPVKQQIYHNRYAYTQLTY